MRMKKHLASPAISMVPVITRGGTIDPSGHILSDSHEIPPPQRLLLADTVNQNGIIVDLGKSILLGCYKDKYIPVVASHFDSKSCTVISAILSWEFALLPTGLTRLIRLCLNIP